MTDQTRFTVLDAVGHVMITARCEGANVSLAVNANRNIPVVVSPDEAREMAGVLTRMADAADQK